MSNTPETRTDTMNTWELQQTTLTGSEIHHREEAEIIGIKEVTDILGISRSTLYRWMKDGRVTGKKLGGQWRFYRDDVYRLLSAPHREQGEIVEKSFEKAIETYRQLFKSIKIDDEKILELTPVAPDEEDREESSRSPVSELFDLILIRAVMEEASDIHIDPYGNSIRIRHRDMGTLYNICLLPEELNPLLAIHIKKVAGCEHDLNRVPQNGKFTRRIGEREVIFRANFFPCIEGEAIELRILDKNIAIPPVTELGLNPADAEKLSDAIHAKSGLIIVTGPTGSGKTTALYSCLQEINTEGKNILTVEDPVEISFKGITQSQVLPDRGYTFAKAIRAMFRHDPDVIMVGEIRDLDIMRFLLQASITGHLAFTALHAPDTVSAIKRLLDLGVEPFLVNDSVSLIISGRIVRRICRHCKEEVAADPELIKKMAFPLSFIKNSTYRGRGCNFCHGKGYKGMTAIYEVLSLTDEVKHLIDRNAPISEIRKAALEAGMNTMRSEAKRKVKEGITTLEEIYKVLYN
ncbi:MAG: Flp pilus assembly complex ATPase component TadA [Candidatus Eremiobacteraeota bacterium]|nr:Flp pilus assembly complex ATPase component TadA [Candidatus Eremiobacteraeota bacterium]